MPIYRVHRLRNHLRDHFRFAPHVTGAANIKPRDYEPAGEAQGSSPYAAFFALKDSDAALLPGDVLESADDASLRIYKYVGFEEAQWILPEAKPVAGAESTLVSENEVVLGTV